MMLGADGNPYIVKFQNNPQHIRVLVNELLGTRLAAAVGLNAPACEVIDVTDWLIENTPDLDLDLGPRRERCKAGACFGSRLVGGLMPGHLFDYLPEEQLAEVENLQEFAGILAFDKWTCNVDGRQAVYSRNSRQKKYHATFIDFGYCFNAGEWIFRDAPLRGIFARNVVYQRVLGWQSFEPWLSRIEQLAPQKIWEIANSVPPEWYGGELAAIEALVEELVERRRCVRELIDQFHKSARAPFPNWNASRQ